MQLPPRVPRCIDATEGDALRRAAFKMGLFSTAANVLLTGLALVWCDARLRIVPLILAVNAAFGYGIARRLRAMANAAFETMTVFVGDADARVRSVETANCALQTQLRAHQDAEARLRDADRRKDEFLATLAHELRNPLAPIRHAVKLLDVRTANPQQQQWGRAVISRQVQRMALLLDDLLDIARITRGHLNLKIEVVELRSVVEAALEVARPLMEAKQQRLVVTMPEEPLMVTGDSLRLSQCLSNLLTNAAKYTDERGCISLTATLSDSELKLAVRDTGIGIDPDSVGGIFEIFSQVHSAVDRAEGGLGIGLALVKGLAELHGGRVEVASEGVGCGSEFALFLPRSLVFTQTDVHLPAGAKARGVVPVGCKLLIADDNRDAVDSMAMIMELAGYEVSVAYTGHEALDAVRRHWPDAILLDIGMPDMTGYDVARVIREIDREHPICLIAVTGWGQMEDRARTRAAGFDYHLTKPVDPDHVTDLLREHLSTRAGG